MHFRSGGADPGRDGCRVPLPVVRRRAAVRVQRGGRLWPSRGSASRRPGAPRTVDVQLGDPGSTLNLYRDALRIRRLERDLGDGPLRWLDAPDGVLAFARGDGFIAITNLSGDCRGAPDRGRRPAPGKHRARRRPAATRRVGVASDRSGHSRPIARVADKGSGMRRSR